MASICCMLQGSLHEDICQSEGEVAFGRDVVADFLTQMRRPPPLNRKKRGTTSQEQEDDSSASLGEVVQRHRITCTCTYWECLLERGCLLERVVRIRDGMLIREGMLIA